MAKKGEFIYVTEHDVGTDDEYSTVSKSIEDAYDTGEGFTPTVYVYKLVRTVVVTRATSYNEEVV